jgi:glycosyltransferase involved in cell wall biosynthesis
MLKHLIFNFAAITPELAGGVATVCQSMAHHIPEGLGDVKTTLLLGPGDWQARYPLPAALERLSIRGLSSRKAAIRLDRHLRRKARPGLGGALAALPITFGLRPPLVGRHMEGTILHCPYQVVHPLPPRAWNLPYVINLHDIQHEHLPDFFTPTELAWRREAYLASAQHAMAICVVDEWTRRDVLAHLPIEPAKVYVAPFGPSWDEPAPLEQARIDALQKTYDLPGAFLFYPAQTWPHKNHERLIEALALLRRERGLRIPLICTGHLNDHYPKLVERAATHGLEDEVRFLGLIPAPDVQALYRLALGVVIPTLFEGGPGIPVLEAMALGAPLAAARTCGIPDAVGEAALLFDPLSVPDMAEAVAALWQREDLRRELVDRGRARMAGWSWSRATATYEQIYREVLAQWSLRPGIR